jgi:hypothetical protein
MFSVPDGRAANQPLAVDTFSPPMAASLPGALVSLAVIGSPASVDAADRSGDSLPSFAFCSGVAGRRCACSTARRTRPRVPVVLAGVLAGDGGDLGGEQVHDQAVLVGRPHGAVAAQEARAGAFLAAEAERAVEQPGGEPLEADRHFAQPPAEAGDHAVDHRCC